MSSVGQLVVMPGAGLGTEERSCNCRYKYYDPCQHPFIVVTITFTSIMHSTILQLQNFVFTVLIMMRDVQMLIRAQHCCLKSEDCVLTCTQRQQASLIVN